MKKGKNNINTGRLLRDFLQKNRISNAALGRDINRNGYSITKYVESDSIQTAILIEICHATKHNFFQDIANEIPAEFTITKDHKLMEKPIIAQLQEEINVLKQEMNVLRIQNELLMKLKGGILN